mgnify:CR=1 FL=1
MSTDRGVLDALIDAGAERVQDKVGAFTAADIAIIRAHGGA